MATLTKLNKSSNPTWTPTSKTTGADTQKLKIDGTYFLKIDGTYNLLIQSATTGTSWSKQSKN